MTTEIDVDRLVVVMAEGARVIDVREPDEYAEAHVPGVELVPLGMVPDNVDRLAGHDGPLYIICRSGARSLRAAEYLEARGIEAISVAGGTMAWVQRGLDYDTGADS
ncbi:MAG TPA: rhodanese-like domain-containing protein [Microcella sp.]|nr:rhodanese-like domain-containing protein [Microcella sp.]